MNIFQETNCTGRRILRCPILADKVRKFIICHFGLFALKIKKRLMTTFCQLRLLQNDAK